MWCTLCVINNYRGKKEPFLSTCSEQSGIDLCCQQALSYSFTSPARKLFFIPFESSGLVRIIEKSNQVIAVCQVFEVFLIRKFPSSITLALVKSIEWLLRQANDELQY